MKFQPSSAGGEDHIERLGPTKFQPSPQGGEGANGGKPQRRTSARRLALLPPPLAGEGFDNVGREMTADRSLPRSRGGAGVGATTARREGPGWGPPPQRQSAQRVIH